MGSNAFLEILLLFLIVLDGYNASFGWEHRKLADLDPSKTTTPARDSPSPTPVPGEKNSDPKPIGETKSNGTGPVSTNDTRKVDQKGSNGIVPPTFPPIAKMGNETVDPNGSKLNNSTPASPPPVTKANDEKDHKKDEEKDKGKSYEKEKKKNDEKNIQASNTNKSCDGLNNLNTSCHDQNNMVGCIFEIGSKYLVVLVQNGVESAIKVNISSVESNLGHTEVAKHQTAMINITLASSEITKVTLNTGHGDCDLQLSVHVPEGKFFVRFPSYDKLLTPVNGAYFLIIAVIIFGGTWAFCKCRTKKRHDGNQYQELEMALPESATNAETTDGWDQGWDDDWNEDMAVKSPGRLVAGISANGLTSRSSNKDGWENNWDD